MRTMVSDEQVTALEERLDALRGYLEIEQKRVEIANLEEKTAVPSFWEDQAEAQRVMKQIRQLKY